MLSNHLTPCHSPLLLPSIFPSIRVFSNESALRIRWPKYWGYTVIPMNIQGLFPLGLTGLFDIITFEDQLSSFRASLVAQRLKRLPGMWETGFNHWVGKIPWRRKRQPTPVFLPGESQGWGSLVGCRLWSHTELDTTKAT